MAKLDFSQEAPGQLIVTREHPRELAAPVPSEIVAWPWFSIDRSIERIRDAATSVDQLMIELRGQVTNMAKLSVQQEASDEACDYLRGTVRETVLGLEGVIAPAQLETAISEAWAAGISEIARTEFHALDLAPLIGSKSQVPEFPAVAFGERWAKWITETAEAAGAPPAYVGCALIAASGALIGNARRVRAWAGWEEPSIIWMAIVGDPSAGKSPAMRPVLKLLEPIDREFVERFGFVSAEHEAKVAMAKNARDNWERLAKERAKRGEDPPPFPPEAVTPDPPVCSALRVDDATIEKLAAISHVSPKGLMMGKDELAGLLANLNRYSGGNDRPHWLEAYNGDERRIDRQKSAKPLLIPRWSIGILGGIQPDPFANLMARSGENDGLTSRFLYSWPDPIPPKRPGKKLPWGNDAATAAVKRLFGLSLVRASGTDTLEPHVVPLSADAAEAFQEWRERHDLERVEGLAKDAWGKMPGQALRLALTIELMKWSMVTPETVEPAEISSTSLNAAIEMLDEFFKPMAKRVFGIAAQPADLSAAAALARWIAKEKPKRFNAVSLRQGKGCPSFVRDARTMDQACALLVEAGWLRDDGTRAGGGKGRSSKDFKINPALWPAIARAGHA